MRNKLDPRTKILLLFCISFIIFIYNFPALDLLVVLLLCIIMIWHGIPKQALCFLVLYGVLTFIESFILPVAPRILITLLTVICLYVKKIIPCMMAACLLVQTTKVREFITALRKLHIPEQFIIPFAIMLRYFPTVGEDYYNIKKALKLRGIKDPIKQFEYIAVTLIIAASDTAEELSIAAILRGIDAPNKKITLWDVQMTIADYLVLLVIVVLFITVVYVRIIGGFYA